MLAAVRVDGLLVVRAEPRDGVLRTTTLPGVTATLPGEQQQQQQLQPLHGVHQHGDLDHLDAAAAAAAAQTMPVVMENGRASHSWVSNCGSRTPLRACGRHVWALSADEVIMDPPRTHCPTPSEDVPLK